jgi:hypothetical protein
MRVSSPVRRSPRRRRTLARGASVLAAAVVSVSCSDALPPEPRTLVVRPAELSATTGGQRVQLTAELTGAPTGTPVRWVSEDSLRFVLDTTTTGPHRVIGRTGIYAGQVHVNVLTSYTLVRVVVNAASGLSTQ